MDRLQSSSHRSQVIKFILKRKEQVSNTKIILKMMKLVSPRKHLFLCYLLDIVRTTRLMKFSIKCGMIVLCMKIGRITKILQLMSFILPDTWYEHSLHFIHGVLRSEERRVG